ncbi:DegT/DnrJ/EryC1/StrS family aminotransferase [Kineococcus sp. NPDC059986]|uniref:DegT/DnrJ/EryC1/StrS family aminotransferase n=1 Tax=Kineococcus sp. NPDC059986 TaxID=3155538 RepID=UPI00344CD641
MSVDPIPFLDLGRAQRELHAGLDEAWRSVTRSARFVGGPFVEAFEEAWAVEHGIEHAVGVANGTDALELVLRGLGVGPGDEVVVPANTFIATAEAVLAVGAVPHFVDVDPETLLVTPETVAEGITDRTAAVIVVHLYGQAADVPGIAALAARTGAVVVEDCAQAQGARWDGRPVGTMGVAGCTSFYPGKNLGAFGDGGAVITRDASLARAVRRYGDHGRSEVFKYEHPVVGRNSRLDALQAAVLLVKLPHLEDWNFQRRAAAEQYRSRLAGDEAVELVKQDPSSTSVHHLMVVRVEDRDRVQADLTAAGIGTAVHYPVPCHQQKDYTMLPRTCVEETERSSPRLLSLPMFPGITRDEVDRACDELVATVRARG